MRNGKSFRIVLSTLTVVTLAVIAPQIGSSQDAPDPETVAVLLETPLEEDFVLGQVVVKLRTARGVEPDLQTVESERKEAGLDDEFTTTSGGELIFRLDPGRAAAKSVDELRSDTLAAVEAMRGNPEVEYAEPNFLMQIVRDPNDTRYPDQWHYRVNGTGGGRSPGGIGLPTVWDTNRGAASVVVAVIDTGILPNHPDIVGSPNLLPGFDMISFFGVGGDPDIANDGDGRENDPTDPGDAVTTGECRAFPPRPPSPRPNSWHGTHVAGTVGVGRTDNNLGVAGINWSVGMVPVRVLGKCGGASTDIADGIRWAAGLPVPGVPNNPNPADVINLSLGGLGTCASSRVQQNAIADVVAAGVTVVVAAGNDAQDAANFRPASCDGVITVAASDFRGRLVSRYSNFGATIEILAPGGDVQRDDDSDGNPDGVLSMVDPSSGTYAFYNGTSMAAPHVAGVAALMLSVDPSLTPADILTALQTTARPRSSGQCPNPCGAGLLDADAALDAVGPGQLILSPSSFDVRVGGSFTLTATTLPGLAVNFSSSDPSVLTVTPPTTVANASGVATATASGISAGTATVTAESGGMTDTSQARVSAAAPGLTAWGLLLLALLAAWLYLRRRGEDPV